MYRKEQSNPVQNVHGKRPVPNEETSEIDTVIREVGVSSASEVTASSERVTKSVKVSADASVSTKETLVSSSSSVRSKQSGILSFFKKSSDAVKETVARPSEVVRWEEVDGGELLVGRFGKVASDSGTKPLKVAAFDVDGTVISVNGTHRFPKSATDWKFWNRCVPEKIRQVHEQGYTILLITNQSGISTNPKKKTMFAEKMDLVLPQINVPLHIMVATGKSKYRKPMTGMWDHFMSRISGPEATIDLNASFFVGDAAGRNAGWKMGAKKDFAASDRKWAINVGLPFYTPDEYFLGSPPTTNFVLDETGFDPLLYSSQRPLFTPTNRPLIPDPIQPEIVLFVGYPGSGKSAFAERWLVPKGYIHVNQDTLKTREKCIAACKAAIKQGTPVVVDNTNPDVTTRKYYIDVAKSLSCPIRCFHFQATPELAKHNDLFRAFGAPRTGISSRTVLPDMAFGSFRNRYMEPSVDEGFSEIKKIWFSLDFEHLSPTPADAEGGESDRNALVEELTKKWRRWYV